MGDFSRKPMYLLTIVSRDKEKRSRTLAGALFESKYGMNLVLNPGVVLTRELQEKYYLNVLPYEGDKRDSLPDESAASKPDTGSTNDGSDIPDW